MSPTWVIAFESEKAKTGVDFRHPKISDLFTILREERSWKEEKQKKN